MSRDAQAAGQYYARKANRTDSAFLVAVVTFAANPSNDDTLTIGGVVTTFGTEVTIGSTTYATLQNLITYLENLNNTIINPLLFTNTGGNVLTIYSTQVNADPQMTVTASAASVTAATTLQATTRARIPL